MRCLLGGLGLLLAGALGAGCEGSSKPQDPAAELDGNFSGLYINPAGGTIVSTNSGNPVTQFTLTQTQGQLRAVDNNGQVFTGTFTVEYAQGGMVELTGQAGGNVPVRIEGYLESTDTNAWLIASWIEPNQVSPVYATAQVVPFSPTNPAVWRP